MQRERIARQLVLVFVLVIGCARPHAESPSASSLCPPGAALVAGSCVCRSDLRLLVGACVAPRVLAAHCGPLALAGPEVCAPRPPCERGRARDLGSGECLARREVRAIAASLGMLVADDQVLACSRGTALTYSSGDRTGGSPRLDCAPLAAAVTADRCPAGSIATGAQVCVRVIEAGPSANELRVDVVRWLHGVLGPESTTGAPPLCVVSLAFPDNDVTQVVVDVRASAASGPLDAAATVDLAEAMSPLVEALRNLGGTASQAEVAATVSCRAGKSPRDGPDAARPTPENDVGR